MRAMRYQSADPADIDAFIHAKDWHLQQKVDGTRCMIHVDTDGTVQTLSGNGGTLRQSAVIPTVDAIHDELARLVARAGVQVVLDGEIVDGHYWAFDLVRWGRPGCWALTETSPWFTRALVLRRAFKAFRLDPDLFSLVPTAMRENEKRWLWKRVVADGLEGVVAKHRDGEYCYGQRVDHMLKVKQVLTVDCVVMRRDSNGKTNVHLGVYDPAGDLFEIANASMIGKPDVRPGQVVEVACMYAGAGGRLVQPRVVRPRPDKFPRDCTDEQLRTVNRDVITDMGWDRRPESRWERTRTKRI